MKIFSRTLIAHPLVRPLLLSVVLIVSSYLIVSGTIRYIKTQTALTSIGIVGTPHLIHPLYHSLSRVYSTRAPIFYRSLITFDDSSQPQADLADSWEISEDKLTYTIYLKQNQVWADKKPITAADVVYTYSLLNDPSYEGSEKKRFAGVTITQVNEFTVSFTLTEAFAPFLESLNLGVIPHHIWEDISIADIPTSIYSIEPVGSTEFSVIKVTTKEDSISHMRIRNNRTKQEYLLLFLNSEKALSDAIKVGTVDVGLFTQIDLASQFSMWNNVSTTAHQVCGSSVTWFSNQDEAANDAVSDPTFNEAIASLFTQSDDLPSLRYALATNHWAYQDETINTSKTPEEIRASFAAISTETPLKVSIMPDVPPFVSIQDIQNAFSDYGLNTSITLISKENAPQFLFDKAYDVLIARQDFGHDPDQYVFWHSAQTDLKTGGLNISNYKNRRMDKALEDGRSTTNEDSRREAYAIMQQRLATDMPALFFEYPNTYIVSRLNSNIESFDSCLWQTSDWLNKILQR